MAAAPRSPLRITPGASPPTYPVSSLTSRHPSSHGDRIGSALLTSYLVRHFVELVVGRQGGALAVRSRARGLEGFVLLVPLMFSEQAVKLGDKGTRIAHEGTLLSQTVTSHCRCKKSVCYHMARAHFSTDSSGIDQPKESAEELYQKMLKSVEAQTMPPNAWLWSMISSCSSEDDIKLLFQILQKLRIFRLSNLRINANFNDHLCMKVSEACARVGVLDYGLKVLWNHNVYGITPTIGSAHYLLQHAKEHNDTKLMEKIMQVLRRNSLPLQPGTADIVFSICYNTDRWDLLSKYAARFVQAGVKLRRTAFDVWMEFAAKVENAKDLRFIALKRWGEYSPPRRLVLQGSGSPSVDIPLSQDVGRTTLSPCAPACAQHLASALILSTNASTEGHAFSKTHLFRCFHIIQGMSMAMDCRPLRSAWGVRPFVLCHQSVSVGSLCGCCEGDSQSIWNINSLRGKSIKHYTLTSGFACVKGSLLERRPENAAATIKLLHKHLPDQKKPFVKDELQKLVAEWPTEVIKRQKKDGRKAMEEALIEDIPKMISSMAKSGLDISVDLDKLTRQPEAA
ncbi:hypothetical protein TRIUR3_20912 [Triticum urartu]|uniref:RING finger and CHY zinc finger domain-containing protein 1 n=1 Tax=Triticum urartu TaxID=4572 RepID=M8A8P1_TRIUA|nr:hypothetical protein TRIUR3_20912 [Triticum urartu]